MIVPPQAQVKRHNSDMVADALNKIKGIPVTDFSRELSTKWAKGGGHGNRDEGNTYCYS